MMEAKDAWIQQTCHKLEHNMNIGNGRKKIHRQMPNKTKYSVEWHDKFHGEQTAEFE